VPTKPTKPHPKKKKKKKKKKKTPNTPKHSSTGKARHLAMFLYIYPKLSSPHFETDLCELHAKVAVEPIVVRAPRLRGESPARGAVARAGVHQRSELQQRRRSGVRGWFPRVPPPTARVVGRDPRAPRGGHGRRKKKKKQKKRKKKKEKVVF
jgi:hypothetical protein